MKILTKDELPKTADDYFKHYHERAVYEQVVTTKDLVEILKELRLAYVKYESRRDRIIKMARVVEVGIKSREGKDETLIDDIKSLVF